MRAAREAFTASMPTIFTISAIGVLAPAVVAVPVMRDRKAEPARAGARSPSWSPDVKPDADA